MGFLKGELISGGMVVFFDAAVRANITYWLLWGFSFVATLFSPEFLMAFWFFFLVYWLMSPWGRVQNILLLLAGYYFVGLAGIYPLLVLLSWSLCVCLLVQMAVRARHPARVMPVMLCLLVGYFIVFKYYAPLNEWAQTYLDALHAHFSLPAVNILLPLGLSFYLFNSVSLVLSVIKKEVAKPAVIDVLLYVSFVPTLIAGPVNRAVDLLPQIASRRRSLLDYKRAFYLIALALVKLFMLSSWLNDTFVTPVFSLPQGQNGWDCLLAVYGWAWNIYFNFSGYTDLVTGIALLLGYRVAQNFSHPYQATSLKDFWRDWHISLSTFIRDYIYFPLGGNRKGGVRTQINVMLAMMLSGLWHGAGLTFLFWGGLHGAGLVVYNLWKKWGGIRLPGVIARLLTFHFVCLAWIFFRADSLSDTATVLGNISDSSLTSLSALQLRALILFVGVIIIYPAIVDLRQTVLDRVVELRWHTLPLVIIPLLALAFFFAPSGVPGFIYANF